MSLLPVSMVVFNINPKNTGIMKVEKGENGTKLKMKRS